ncbi:MAG: hypothetical protein RBS24_02685 [Bacilli bacterium]|nr:hypothetical protein [Bacilli bacterium]
MLKRPKTLIGLFPLLFVVSACTNTPSTSLEAKKEIPHTRAHYINDNAKRLSSVTNYYIYENGTTLTEVDSQATIYQEKEISGAEVVVSTYVGKKNSLDEEKLFADWDIGENEMGLLLVFYFDTNKKDNSLQDYLGMSMVIGDKLETFVSQKRINEIYREHFNAPDVKKRFAQNVDYALMNFYFGVLEDIYTKAYEWEEYPTEAKIKDFERDFDKDFANMLPPEVQTNISLSPLMWISLSALMVIVVVLGNVAISHLIKRPQE